MSTMLEMSSLPGRDLAAGPEPALQPPSGDRFEGAGGVSLATRTTRGVVINSTFLAAINVLGLLKGLVGATFLTTAEYGVWGLIAVTSTLILWFGAIGVEDKYIQQDHRDQEAAFQTAFTIQCGLAAVLTALILIGMPLFSLVYDAPAMTGPGMALALAMPAAALGTPLWIFWRRMDFLRQRSLQIWDPVVSLVVVLALAAAGVGVWALVIGAIAGGYAAAFAAVRASPYALRFHYEPVALREYASFSWPLFAASATAVLITLVPVLVASRTEGLAAVGAITLATVIAQFAWRVDEVLTQVLYPAICAVKDQTELLFAAFSKSNRFALLWALPCGAAGALFAGDFVHYVIGEKWRFAEFLIQVFAVTAAVNQIGFNWTAFYRALDRTRPIAVANVVLLAGVLGAAIPLLVAKGIDGYAVGVAVATGLFLLVRLYYLKMLFPTFHVVSHVGRVAVPAALGILAVLAIREFAAPGRPTAEVLSELMAFVAVVGMATLVTERALLREVWRYLRGTPASDPVRA